VVATGSGHEKRNVHWAEARGRWDVASGLKKQAQIDELIAFFRSRRGKAYGFRFKDWTDYMAAGPLLGTGDDVLTQFQLVKHYPSGSVIEVRMITLLGLLLNQIDFAAVPQVLRNANPWLVLSCVFLVASGRVLVAYRWHLLVRIANPAVGFGKLLQLTFVSIFLGFAAPGAVAVEAIRVCGLARGTGLAFALSSVLIERLTATSALVCLLLVGLMLGPLNLPQALNLVGGAALRLILVTLATLFVPRLRTLPLLLLPGSVLSPLRAGLESVLTQFDLYCSRPTLVCVAVLSIVLQVLRVLEIIALAAALDISIDPAYFFVVVPISTFLSLLPISARGLGVRESVYVGLLGVVGVDTAAALTLSLLSFVIASAVGLLPGALLYATGGIGVDGTCSKDASIDLVATERSIIARSGRLVRGHAGRRGGLREGDPHFEGLRRQLRGWPPGLLRWAASARGRCRAHGRAQLLSWSRRSLAGAASGGAAAGTLRFAAAAWAAA
jgi:uncharacterized membrane protein YbhN (UPF0104 family)